MKSFLITLMSVALFFLSGCATKKPITHSEPYLISVKNKSIALSDTGFINHVDRYTNVQIFSAGNVLFNLEIVDNSICLDGQCLDKQGFNERFFQTKHYPELMENILSQSPIYNGLALQKTPMGFEQTITLEAAHIRYSVEDKSVLFKDSLNGILIRLKPLP